METGGKDGGSGSGERRVTGAECIDASPSLLVWSMYLSTLLLWFVSLGDIPQTLLAA